jgi:hypothetical protein
LRPPTYLEHAGCIFTLVGRNYITAVNLIDIIRVRWLLN